MVHQKFIDERQKIAIAAYLKWEDEGYPAGRELENWLAAEREEQQIRELAFFIWESEGYPDGRALDNWLAAEKRIRGNKETSNSKWEEAGDFSLDGELFEEIARAKLVREAILSEAF
jgi:hypothetical protein